MVEEYQEMLCKNEEAVCFSNYRGRILSANSRFCRMFGFRSEEAEWHFLLDLHRNTEDWDSLREYVERYGSVQHYYARMRNRKGRSFHCLISRVKAGEENGRPVYASVVQKITAQKAKEAGILDLQKTLKEKIAGQNGGTVYLMVCQFCQKVKDSHGNWVVPAEGSGTGFPVRSRHVCPQCAAVHYPEIPDTTIQVSKVAQR